MYFGEESVDPVGILLRSFKRLRDVIVEDRFCVLVCGFPSAICELRNLMFAPFAGYLADRRQFARLMTSGPSSQMFDALPPEICNRSTWLGRDLMRNPIG